MRRATLLKPSARHALAEHARFVGAWLANPIRTASIVPSSRHLATLMVREIDPDGGRVVELGGGTGAFTRAILKRGLPPEKLEVVEINADFARDLRAAFPQMTVIEAPAEALTAHAAGQPGDYQAVISGLPMLAIRRSEQIAILREAFALLAPGGAFYQFTYARRSPIPAAVLRALDLRIERAGQTLRNFPPARVYRIVRAGD